MLGEVELAIHLLALAQYVLWPDCPHWAALSTTVELQCHVTQIPPPPPAPVVSTLVSSQTPGLS